VEKLLKKVDFKASNDHLVLAGDMISKGPDSPGVIDLAIELGATAVRGNHEDRIILAYRDLHSNLIQLQGPHERPDRKEDDMEEESFSHGDYKDRLLANQLSKKQIEWLEDCPLILRIGDLEGMGEVAVVHGGLVPGVKFKNQDPFAVMNMRTMDLETHVPSAEREGISWTKVWNHYQSHLPKEERVTVIYGHDSKRGLQIGKYTKGLDSGCLKGGQLSALIISPGKNGKMKQKVVSMNCPDNRQKARKVATGKIDAKGKGKA
jgi:diadenosine tetraphosphatase ApaH/serine/threonine PP2A family protein phosphatase